MRAWFLSGFRGLFLGSKLAGGFLGSVSRVFKRILWRFSLGLGGERWREIRRCKWVVVSEEKVFEGC